MGEDETYGGGGGWMVGSRVCVDVVGWGLALRGMCWWQCHCEWYRYCASLIPEHLRWIQCVWSVYLHSIDICLLPMFVLQSEHMYVEIIQYFN